MHITAVILAVASAAGVTGQLLDAWTTNWGVNIAKVATEGNPAAKGLVSHPTLNYIVKGGLPFLAGVLGIAVVPYLVGYPEAGDAQVFISLTVTAAGVWGFFCAKANAKINKGWHL